MKKKGGMVVVCCKYYEQATTIVCGGTWGHLTVVNMQNMNSISTSLNSISSSASARMLNIAEVLC